MLTDVQTPFLGTPSVPPRLMTPNLARSAAEGRGRCLCKKHSSREEDRSKDKLSEHQIGGLRAVSAEGLQDIDLRENLKGLFWSQTPVAPRLSSADTSIHMNCCSAMVGTAVVRNTSKTTRGTVVVSLSVSQRSQHTLRVNCQVQSVANTCGMHLARTKHSACVLVPTVLNFAKSSEQRQDAPSRMPKRNRGKTTSMWRLAYPFNYSLWNE